VRDGDRRRVAAEVLPASGSFGSTRDGAVKWYRGLGMLETRRRRANGAAVDLPAAWTSWWLRLGFGLREVGVCGAGKVRGAN